MFLIIDHWKRFDYIFFYVDEISITLWLDSSRKSIDNISLILWNNNTITWIALQLDNLPYPECILKCRPKDPPTQQTEKCSKIQPIKKILKYKNVKLNQNFQFYLIVYSFYCKNFNKNSSQVASYFSL